MGSANIGHPIAKRFVDGILQRPATGVHLHDFGTQKAHPLHIEPLAPHVLFTHVDRAGLSEERRRGSRRHAVLARSCLGNDAVLAHALGQQRLTDRVVDLVSTGVQQIFAFEEDLDTTQVLLNLSAKYRGVGRPA